MVLKNQRGKKEGKGYGCVLYVILESAKWISPTVKVPISNKEESRHPIFPWRVTRSTRVN